MTQWFDTSCFATPPNFEFGNYEIGQVRGPKFINTDFSLFKRTALGGNRSVEFRLEAFNVFNKAHFSNPNDRLGNAELRPNQQHAIPLARDPIGRAIPVLRRRSTGCHRVG